MKTTIILDDEIYKKLVRESLERYGTTRKLSHLINEKLRLLEKLETQEPKERITFKLGRKLTMREIEEKIEEGLEEMVD